LTDPVVVTKRLRTLNARRGTCQLIGPGSNALRAAASDWVAFGRCLSTRDPYLN